MNVVQLREQLERERQKDLSNKIFLTIMLVIGPIVTVAYVLFDMLSR